MKLFLFCLSLLSLTTLAMEPEIQLVLPVAITREIDFCPICLCELDYTIKNNQDAQSCMLFNRCLHGIHIGCALSLISNARAEWKLSDLKCPICRRSIEQKQLTRVNPDFKELLEHENLFLGDEANGQYFYRYFFE